MAANPPLTLPPKSEPGPRTGSEVEAALRYLGDLPRAHLTGFKAPETPGLDGALGVIAAGHTVISLKPYIDEWAMKPHRRTGTVQVATEASFVEAFLPYERPQHSLVTIARNGASLVVQGVVDYHNRGEGVGPVDGSFADFRIQWAAPPSPAAVAWGKITNDTLTSLALVSFLEARLPELAMPTLALQQRIHALGAEVATVGELLAAIRGLVVTQKRTVRDSVALDSFATQFEFVEQNSPSVVVPAFFAVSYPPWEGVAEPITYLLRLRYQITPDNKLTWVLVPLYVDEAYNMAIQNLQDRLTTACQVPVLQGMIQP